MADWTIEPLDGYHDRAEFSCGKDSLDNFLRSLVSQYERRILGRAYVALAAGKTQAGESPKRARGYYTLASGSVNFQNLPENASKKLPKHPVPVALLGRLAVDTSAKGQGLRGRLLTDALRRCLTLSSELGIHAVEVHALDEEAKLFYEHYGFATLLDDERHLYLPIATLRDAFEK